MTSFLFQRFRQWECQEAKYRVWPPWKRFCGRLCFWLDFFSNFWHSSDMFWLFLTCKCNKQKYLNYRNFNKPFPCNIQSLETWKLRDRDRDGIWNLRDRDRDSQKWISRRVSRPRPSLETPSLLGIICHTCSVCSVCRWLTQLYRFTILLSHLTFIFLFKCLTHIARPPKKYKVTKLLAHDASQDWLVGRPTANEQILSRKVLCGLAYCRNRVRNNKKQALYVNTWKHSQVCSWETE